MGTGRATSRDWEKYYARAERKRLATGDVDPFLEQAARVAKRERIFMALGAVSMTAVMAAFYVLLIR